MAVMSTILLLPDGVTVIVHEFELIFNVPPVYAGSSPLNSRLSLRIASSAQLSASCSALSENALSLLIVVSVKLKELNNNATISTTDETIVTRINAVYPDCLLSC